VKEPHCRSAQVWNALSRDFTVYLHTHALIHDYEWNEPYLPLPSQPKLVLILVEPTPEGWEAELAPAKHHHGE